MGYEGIQGARPSTGQLPANPGVAGAIGAMLGGSTAGKTGSAAVKPDPKESKRIATTSGQPHGSEPNVFGTSLRHPEAITPAAAQQLLARLDSNKDGKFNKATLLKAIDNPAFKGNDAVILATVLQSYDKVAGLTNDQWGSETDITRQDVAVLSQTTFREAAAEVRQILAAEGRALFAPGPKVVSGSAVTQGAIGDCYFVSALSGLADANPQAIRGMVKEVAANRFQVSFPGKRPVTVSLTDAQIALYAKTGGNGLWAAALERAYAKLKADGTKQSEASDYQAIAGDNVATGITALTGDKTTCHHLTPLLSDYLGTEAMTQALRKAFAASPPKVVAAGIRSGIVSNRTWEGGMLMGHAYTVQGIDPKTQQIRVRDPHGKGGPQGDGTYTLSPEQFHSIFDTLAIQGE
jgi:hypothetical protein